MSRFSGRHGAGYRREVKAAKRSEANERNARTAHERTKRHRLGKCECEAS